MPSPSPSPVAIRSQFWRTSLTCIRVSPPTLFSRRADLREKSVGGDTRLQVRLVRQNWDRMATGDGDGDGMEMVTNYLGYSEFHYDTGMRDPLEAGGAPRPLEQTWAKLPSNG